MPAGPVQSPTDLLADAQLKSRGLFCEVWVGGKPVVLPELGPRLTESPGKTRRAVVDLGADTDAVLRELAGVDDPGLAALREAGITR